MKEEVSYTLDKLKKALASLKEGTRQAKDELGEDGVIQRFEFTFELLWKSLKIILQDKGVLTKTPKDSLKGAFQVGLLENEALFLDMLEDRNRTSHIYSKEDSHEIFKRIRNHYVPQMEALLEKLEKKTS